MLDLVNMCLTTRGYQDPALHACGGHVYSQTWTKLVIVVKGIQRCFLSSI